MITDPSQLRRGVPTLRHLHVRRARLSIGRSASAAAAGSTAVLATAANPAGTEQSGRAVAAASAVTVATAAITAHIAAPTVEAIMPAAAADEDR
jgi:hypothetical protein